MTDQLMADVYKDGVLAAYLRRDANGMIHFTYRADYKGPAIATSLPLEAEYTAESIPPFFQNLLPEGYRLDVVSSEKKISKNNTLGLLLVIGSDVPGDVQIIEHGRELYTAPAALVNNPEVVSFAELMGTVDRRGLPGVQEKLSAVMKTLPVHWTGAGYDALLKISPQRMPGLVENEAAHLTAAALMGIPVAQHELVYDRDGVSGLMVSRFDRTPSGGRIAMEDGAQILGVPSGEKYTEDNPAVTTESVIQAMVKLAASPAIARRNLYMHFLYAWLTGNGDLHAKNISLLKGRRGWEVAPIYDIPCSLVHIKSLSMALSVNGKDNSNPGDGSPPEDWKITVDDWLALAETIGLPPKVQKDALTRALKAARAVRWPTDRAAPGYVFNSNASPFKAMQKELERRQDEFEEYLHTRS